MVDQLIKSSEIEIILDDILTEEADFIRVNAPIVKANKGALGQVYYEENLKEIVRRRNEWFAKWEEVLQLEKEIASRMAITNWLS